MLLKPLQKLSVILYHFEQNSSLLWSYFSSAIRGHTSWKRANAALRANSPVCTIYQRCDLTEVMPLLWDSVSPSLNAVRVENSRFLRCPPALAVGDRHPCFPFFYDLPQPLSSEALAYIQAAGVAWTPLPESPGPKNVSPNSREFLISWGRLSPGQGSEETRPARAGRREARPGGRRAGGGCVRRRRGLPGASSSPSASPKQARPPRRAAPAPEWGEGTPGTAAPGAAAAPNRGSCDRPHTPPSSSPGDPGRLPTRPREEASRKWRPGRRGGLGCAVTLGGPLVPFRLSGSAGVPNGVSPGNTPGD